MTTKYQLTTALLTGGPLVTPTVKFKITNSVAREDGSGHCFNVGGIDAKGKTVVAFVRTVD